MSTCSLRGERQIAWSSGRNRREPSFRRAPDWVGTRLTRKGFHKLQHDIGGARISMSPTAGAEPSSAARRAFYYRVERPTREMINQQSKDPSTECAAQRTCAPPRSESPDPEYAGPQAPVPFHAGLGEIGRMHKEHGEISNAAHIVPPRLLVELAPCYEIVPLARLGQERIRFHA